MEVIKTNKKDPVAIIKEIREKSFDPEHFGSMENYLDWLQKSLWKFNQISIDISGETTEEKCQSMVDSLIENKLLIIE